ncbi:MAG: GNAT family N-acetyltransferase [Bacteroidales bacterium]|nr:GNAT family N-acetyltransferase [Bacteroidales bacterium]
MGGGRTAEGVAIYKRVNGKYVRQIPYKNRSILDKYEIGEATVELKETRRAQEDSYESINYEITNENGTVIGHATIINDDNSAYLERIDIDESYRNKGYGTKAIRQLSSEYGGIIVAPDNEDARRLYERLGYESSDDMYDQGFGVYEI